MRESVDRLFFALANGADKTAVVFEGREWTFAQLDRLSRRYARGLALAGVSAGDRVAVYAETSPEVVVALLGHYRLGALHVPINTRYQGEELSHVLEDSGAKAVLVGAGTEGERVLAEIPQPPALRHRILLGGAGDLAFERLVRTHLPAREADAEPAPKDADTAILLYTSGTTGKSKGVELSFCSIVENTLAVTGLWRFESADRQAIALPLFHVHGLCLGVHGALLHTQTALLFPRFDAERIADAFARDGATVFQGVPTMYVRLLELMAARPEAAQALRRGRLFTAGSAALPADDFVAFEERTGHRILERYGMSETLFTLSNLYEDRRPGTVGLPVPGCEIKIVDDELFVKSNGIMTGYWGKPAETAASFADGWFATGDVARRDADGAVSILGRKSVDVIKSGGFKISAREIEDVLRRHPRVREVAVVGAPDRVWGQRIVAAVVTEGPAPSEEQLIEELSAFCARHLADYKRPRAVRILDELPRNALGKVQKHRILEIIG